MLPQLQQLRAVPTTLWSKTLLWQPLTPPGTVAWFYFTRIHKINKKGLGSQVPHSSKIYYSLMCNSPAVTSEERNLHSGFSQTSETDLTSCDSTSVPVLRIFGLRILFLLLQMTTTAGTQQVKPSNMYISWYTVGCKVSVCTWKRMGQLSNSSFGNVLLHYCLQTTKKDVKSGVLMASHSQKKALRRAT